MTPGDYCCHGRVKKSLPHSRGCPRNEKKNPRNSRTCRYSVESKVWSRRHGRRRCSFLSWVGRYVSTNCCNYPIVTAGKSRSCCTRWTIERRISTYRGRLMSYKLFLSDQTDSFFFAFGWSHH